MATLSRCRADVAPNGSQPTDETRGLPSKGSAYTVPSGYAYPICRADES